MKNKFYPQSSLWDYSAAKQRAIRLLVYRRQTQPTASPNNITDSDLKIAMIREDAENLLKLIERHGVKEAGRAKRLAELAHRNQTTD